MTKEERAAIRARCEAATLGPWYEYGRDVITRELKVGETPYQGEYICEDMEHGDADFIAHARQDIPELLDALTEKDAEIERLEHALKDAQAARDCWARSCREEAKHASDIKLARSDEYEDRKKLEADRDRHKARAEALERAIRRNYKRKEFAELTCDTCAIANDRSACDPIICGKDRRLWEFDEARFMGEKDDA